MEFPQDYESRVALNQSEKEFDYWGLLVVVEQRIVDLQRWNEDGQLSPPERPSSRLINLEAEGQRLKLFTGKQLIEWNLTTGWAGDRAYTKAEKKRLTEWFQLTPGEPQFRSGKGWCCVIIDGDVKATSPQSIFQAKQKEWDALSAAQKSILLSEKARKSSAKHAFFGLKAAVGLTALAALLWGVASALTKFNIL